MSADLSFRFAAVRLPLKRSEPAAADDEASPIRGPAPTTFEEHVTAEEGGQGRGPAAVADAFVGSGAYLPGTEAGRRLLAATPRAEAELLDAQPLDRDAFVSALERLIESVHSSGPPVVTHVEPTPEPLALRDGVWSAFYAAVLARPTRIEDIHSLQVWIRVLHLMGLPAEAYDAEAARVLGLRIGFPPSLLDLPGADDLAGTAPGARRPPRTPADPRLSEVEAGVADCRRAIRRLEAAVDEKFAAARSRTRAAVRLVDGEHTHVRAVRGGTANDPDGPVEVRSPGSTEPPSDTAGEPLETSPWRIDAETLGPHASDVTRVLEAHGLSLASPATVLISGLQEAAARLVAEAARLRTRRRLTVSRHGRVVARDHVVHSD